MKPSKEKQVAVERLPYERPGVISEEVFETLALSCHSSIPQFCDPVDEGDGGS